MKLIYTYSGLLNILNCNHFRNVVHYVLFLTFNILSSHRIIINYLKIIVYRDFFLYIFNHTFIFNEIVYLYKYSHEIINIIQCNLLFKK